MRCTLSPCSFRASIARSLSATLPLWPTLAIWLLAFGSASTVAHASELRLTPIVKAVQSSRRSVVNIQGQKTVTSPVTVGSAAVPHEVNGMGTGVVIDPRGYLLTNHHVVAGVRRITATLDDGQVLTAHLIAHDEETDLAVIKVRTPRQLPVINIGTSHDLMTGETVIALGNAYGYTHTVTRGIISALHRDVQVTDTQSYEDLIQTDASINPGNSGGPLLNVDGEMVGVNVAVRAGAQGIGFAIPVDKAMEVAAELLSVERLENRQHGIYTRELSDRRAVVVRRTRSGSPGDQCGLETGDVIASVASVPIRRRLDLERALLGRTHGESVPIEVLRGDQRLVLDLSFAGTTRHADVRPAVVESDDRIVRTNRDDSVWDVLGLNLIAEPKSTFAGSGSPFRGGMKVTEVRPDGPAAAQGILPGDVLVGMHNWETASERDIDYIVRRAKHGSLGNVRFFVLRDGQTLRGDINVASNSARRATTVR